MRAAVLGTGTAHPIAGPRSLTLSAWAATTLVLSGTSAAVAAGGAADHPALVAVARALMVGVPMAVGLYAWQRRPDERFGPLLILAGGTWFVTTLAESGDPAMYSIGRAAGWTAEIVLAYLVLSFPTGHLPERRDRLILGAFGAVIATLYVPTLLLSQDFPVPSPYTSCQADCPDNAFFALGTQPAFVDAVMVPLRELLSIALFAAATARLLQRVGASSRLMRRTLTPVLGIAATRLVVLAVMVGLRRTNPDSTVLDAGVWLIALLMPAMAIGFLAGLLRQRLYVARAVQRLATRLSVHPDARELRSAVAEAFEDPTVQLALPAQDVRGCWVDPAGEPVSLPAPGSGRCVTELQTDGRVVGAIVHDEVLRDQDGLVTAAGAYVAGALENTQLTNQIEASRRELRRSRARIVAAADRERRRIERDLHDGAQQRLVALRIELELLEEVIPRDPARGLKRLHTLGQEVEEALDEIRALAHGVYPPLLADRGLAEALRATALRAPLPTSIRAAGLTRQAPELESAVYFCVLEALQNAAKHAADARRVTVTLDEGRDLRFTVRDDGAGFDPGSVAPGDGLTNVRDRLAAVGGTVRIDSAPGRGTVVSGRVPLT